MMSPLQSHSPFSDLAKSVQQALNDCKQVRRSIKGETLLVASDPWQHAYWLHAGVVRMFYLDTQGREHNKRFFIANDFFWPVTPALREKAAGFYIQALTDIHCDVWSYADFRGAFECDKAWLAFSHLWLERLVDSKLARERDWLHLSAAERYQQLCDTSPRLIEQVSAQHIASYLGVTPVSLSRIKNR